MIIKMRKNAGAIIVILAAVLVLAMVLPGLFQGSGGTAGTDKYWSAVSAIASGRKITRLEYEREYISQLQLRSQFGAVRYDQLDKLRLELSRWPGVDTAELDSAWTKRLNAMLDIGRQLTIMLTTLLAFGLALGRRLSRPVLDALRTVAKGGSYLSPQVSDQLLRRIQRGDLESRTVPSFDATKGK